MVANSKFVFLLEKNSEVEPIGLHFGPLKGGIGAPACISWPSPDVSRSATRDVDRLSEWSVTGSLEAHRSLSTFLRSVL